jgi:hypothetical protein
MRRSHIRIRRALKKSVCTFFCEVNHQLMQEENLMADQSFELFL